MFVHYKRLFQVFYKLPSTSVTTPQLWLRLHVLKMLVPAYFSTIHIATHGVYMVPVPALVQRETVGTRYHTYIYSKA